MKSFKQYLINETTKLGTEDQPPQIDRQVIDYARQVVRDCRPYLNEHPKFAENPIFRGIQHNQRKPVVKRRVRKKRKPVDTGLILHDILDQWFEQHFDTRFRSNSMFVFGNSGSAADYGEPSVVFPMGQFEYVWSPAVRDLYPRMRKVINQWIIDNKQELERKQISKDLKLALDAGSTAMELDPTLPMTDQRYEHVKQVIHEAMDNLQYKNTDLSAATRSSSEIMISTNHYYSVPLEWYRDNRFGQVVEAVLNGDVEKYI